MGQKVKLVKGFRDILPPAISVWQWAEKTVGQLFESYGFLEVRLPILEHTELFARGIGETTDIVEKEMYSFPDRKERSLCLRPEGTASVVRAYLSAGAEQGSITKWYYSGPMFRYERPQKGRYRQFWQMGLELLNDPGPDTDAELLAMLALLFSRLGIKSVVLEINSLGCPVCRPVYRDKLVEFLEGISQELCADCKRRLKTNPLRVLDCKNPTCKKAAKKAPSTLDHLCPECDEHFSGLSRALSALEVKYKVNPRIVRGLDYYNRTAFEFLAKDGLGSQNAIAAGGRYDGLIEELGGPKTPAFGFALGMDRLMLLIPEDKMPATGLDLFVAPLGEQAYEKMFPVVQKLRKSGIKTEMLGDRGSKGLKPKMKRADKLGVRYVLIIGENELESGTAQLRDMKGGEQQNVSLEDLPGELGKIIKP